uniref:Uncharacterized protein n=1 Tax=Euplotes harpa TaxID=151035 RepID=A0A7S3J6S4_9SPIT
MSDLSLFSSIFVVSLMPPFSNLCSSSSSFSVALTTFSCCFFFFSARLRLNQKIKNTMRASRMKAATIEKITTKGRMYFSKQYWLDWQIVSSHHFELQLLGPLQDWPEVSPDPSQYSDPSQ